MKSQILVLMSLILLGQLAAAQLPEGVPTEELAARRARLFERLGEGLAIIPGARKNPSYDEFRQNHQFFWLTGLETADCYLILNGAKKKSYLVTPRQEFGAGWEGTSHQGKKDLMQRALVDEVIFEEALTEELLRKTAEGLSQSAPILLPCAPAERGMIVDDAVSPWYRRFQKRNHPLDHERSRESGLRAALGEVFPGRKIEDLSPFLKSERVVKSAFEQEMIAKATTISTEAMAATIRATKPGLYEYELGALFEYESKRRGAQGLGYAAIVGSGPNSCLPHYSKKSRRLERGDLIVCDAACSYGYYVSDVTRTFPASGRFSPDQAEVYDAVLAAQQAAIDAVKPGVSFSTLNQIATKVIRERGFGAYILHGLGHHVGMSVHDPGGYLFKLKPGHILTIEPGIYIPKKNIGVRIEDVILVTEDGCEILSSGVPRSRAEIEAMMKDEAR